MGGPCKVIEDGKARQGPDATDNFQLRPFMYEQVEYFSCEMAYQVHARVSLRLFV